MKPLPIRLRLTLWYFVMFASAALLLTVTSWLMLRRSLDATEYHDLQERAEDVQLLLQHSGPNESIEALQKEFTEIYEFKDDGKYFQVLDQDGHWLYRSKRMIAADPSLPLPGRLPKDGTISGFQQGTHPVRTLAYPITVNGRSYSVQTGMSLNRSMALLWKFGADLLLLTPAVLLLAAAGGHFMGRKALRPVAALATDARRINDRNLDTRLPISAANDEISHLSETLNQMLERIDKAFRSVRAFTGNASHELRTPISLLRTEIEVALYQKRTASEYRETLERLHGETVRMTNLVENLMSLARADAGVESVKAEIIDIAQLLQQTEQSWKAAMQCALIDFRVTVPSGDWSILAEPVGIRRLLSILLENARRYTLPGGSVMLSAEPEGDRVILAVRDTGIGIAPEHLSKIFERFYRVNQTHESMQGGSGLGLALARWIAERHGTVLAVESQPGQGSCFFFSIARCSAEAQSDTQSAGIAHLSHY